MAIYHFNVVGEAQGAPFEYDSLQVARCQAIKTAERKLCDSADKFWDEGDWRMDVTNDTDLIRFSIFITGIDGPVVSGR